MPFSFSFYLHLTNDRQHAAQPSRSLSFSSFFYLPGLELSLLPLVSPLSSLAGPRFLHRVRKVGSPLRATYLFRASLFSPSRCSSCQLFSRALLSSSPSSVSSSSSSWASLFSRPRPCGIRTGVRFGGTQFELVGITASESTTHSRTRGLSLSFPLSAPNASTAVPLRASPYCALVSSIFLPLASVYCYLRCLAMGSRCVELV